jgi:protein TonB
MIFTIIHIKHQKPNVVLTNRTIHFEFDSDIVPSVKELKLKPLYIDKPPVITVPYITTLEDVSIVENDNPATEYSQSFSVPYIEKIIMLPIQKEQVQVEPVYDNADEMPLFNGGKFESFRDWLEGHLRYPALAEENGISGRVLIKFTINTLGEVCDIQIVKGIDPTLDKEAIRVISSSPKWTPGKIKGKAVKVQLYCPVFFKLK